MAAVKVIGIFDSADEASTARQALLTEGVSANAIRMGPEEGATASTTTTTSSTADDDRDSGFFGWVRSLFSDDDDEHRAYADRTSEAVRRGSCVVAVEAESETQADRAERIMQDHGAVDVDQRAQRWTEEGWTGYDETAPRLSGDDLERERRINADQRVSVVKESLQVGKRDVSRGGVRVVTRIVDRPVEEQVSLREEHAHVERHAVDRPATEADLRGLKEGTIEITERAEEAVIGKTARVVEEIEVGKSVQNRTQTVRDNVRETQVDVEQMAAKTPPGTSRQQGTVDPTLDPKTPKRQRS